MVSTLSIVSFETVFYAITMILTMQTKLFLQRLLCAASALADDV